MIVNASVRTALSTNLKTNRTCRTFDGILSYFFLKLHGHFKMEYSQSLAVFLLYKFNKNEQNGVVIVAGRFMLNNDYIILPIRYI